MICRLSVRGVEPCMIPDMQQKPEQHDLTEENGDTEYEKTRSSYLWVRHEKSFSKFPGSGTIIPALVCLLVSLVWLITSSRKTKAYHKTRQRQKSSVKCVWPESIKAFHKKRRCWPAATRSLRRADRAAGADRRSADKTVTRLKGWKLQEL